MLALCVGHSRPGDSGAVSIGGISEHAFNTRIAAKVCSILTAKGMACAVIDVYQGAGYASAMKWLAQRLTSLKATAAIELHFNCSDTPSATGHEWLFWNSSHEGRVLAKMLDQRMAEAFPKLARRGIKSLGSKDNGAGFLRMTPCPACIAEPFFGSNESDWDLLNSHQDRYAQVIAEGLDDWKGSLL